MAITYLDALEIWTLHRHSRQGRKSEQAGRLADEMPAPTTDWLPWLVGWWSPDRVTLALSLRVLETRVTCFLAMFACRGCERWYSLVKSP